MGGHRRGSEGHGGSLCARAGPKVLLLSGRRHGETPLEQFLKQVLQLFRMRDCKWVFKKLFSRSGSLGEGGGRGGRDRRRRQDDSWQRDWCAFESAFESKFGGWFGSCLGAGLRRDSHAATFQCAEAPCPHAREISTASELGTLRSDSQECDGLPGSIGGQQLWQHTL